MKAGDVLLIGAVGVGAYLLYKMLEPAAAAVETAAANLSNAASAVGGTVSAAAGGVTSAIANMIVWATSSDTVASGNVVMYPSGVIVAISAITGGISYDDAAGVGEFTYLGTAYQICSNPTGGPAFDVNGNYPAYPVSTGCPTS